jgi:hypothetical protein
MKRILASIALLAFSAAADDRSKFPPDTFENFQKGIGKEGLVPFESVARAVGTAILEADFGKDIEKDGPLDVYSEHDYWVIESHPLARPVGFGGGGCGVVIARRDARILFLGCDK